MSRNTQWNRLTPRAVELATAPGAKPAKYWDGGGLCLRVAHNGRGYWVYQAMVRGKTTMVSIGPSRFVSLAIAREEAAKYRLRKTLQKASHQFETNTDRLLREASAPARWEDTETVRPVEKKIASKNSKPFQHFAHQYFDLRMKALRADTRNARIREVENYVMPVLGHVPIADVTFDHLRKVFGQRAQDKLAEGLWEKHYTVAVRLAVTLKHIFDYAQVNGTEVTDHFGYKCEKLKMAFSQVIHKGKPHESMPYEEVPAFMALLREREDEHMARALEFTVLTAARIGSVEKMEWDDIDFEKGHWLCPKQKMKGGKDDHYYPLTGRLLEILQGLPNRKGLVFPRGVDYFSKGVSRLVPAPYKTHGFRTSFMNWAVNEAAFAPNLADWQLAHRLARDTMSHVTAVHYSEGTTKGFNERVPMMQKWDDYCAGRAGKVIKLRRPSRKAA